VGAPCPSSIGGAPIPTVQPTAPRYVPPKLESSRALAPKTQPIARGQSDDNSTTTLRIPTPEELGLGTRKLVTGDEPLDWALVERKLDAAGVTAYQMEKTSNGFRFTCQLTAGPVSGRGGSKNEAVRNALAQLK